MMRFGIIPSDSLNGSIFRMMEMIYLLRPRKLLPTGWIGVKIGGDFVMQSPSRGRPIQTPNLYPTWSLHAQTNLGPPSPRFRGREERNEERNPFRNSKAPSQEPLKLLPTKDLRIRKQFQLKRSPDPDPHKKAPTRGRHTLKRHPEGAQGTEIHPHSMIHPRPTPNGFHLKPIRQRSQWTPTP